MDIYEIFERGALANQALDSVGTYEQMIEKLKADEVPVNDMKELLINLYTVVNDDYKNRVELVKSDIEENGIELLEETYGLDDYAIATIVSEKLEKDTR